MGDSAEKPLGNRRETKRLLRRELFARLREMPAAEKATASGQICRFIADRPEFQKAATVAAFVALSSEPNLDDLIGSVLSNRRLCLPRITQEGSIEMRRVSDFDDLVVGDFKIREPDPDACPVLEEREIDLVLLPGVGFDRVNHARLGRGKGHYDRFLQRLRELESPPLVWGICFSEQLSTIDPEPHDQPVDVVVTENGFAL